MSVFNTASSNGIETEGLLLPSREELGERAFDTIRFWMEEGNSQLLSCEQALQIASWALKIAADRSSSLHLAELKNEVLAELVELPENYG